MRDSIAVAMSGGVDSSVAAWLLQQQGEQTVGVTMRLFTPEELAPGQGERCHILEDCLLYTSPSPRDRTRSRMPSSA